MRALIAIFTLLCFSVADAQDYLFRVMASKGDVKVEQAGSQKSLYTGSKITKDAKKVIVAENAYVGLVHANGRSWELKNPGTYVISDIVSKVTAADKGFAEKYADYAWTQMNKGGNDSRNMEVTGAVFRTTGAIHGFSVRKSNVMESSVLLKWTLVDNAKTYKVTIKNRYDEEVLSVTTRDNAFKLDLSNLALSKEQVYLWGVAVVEWDGSTENTQKIKSEDYALNYIGADKEADVREEFRKVAAELDPQNSALDAVIIASFYEQHGLFMDALTYYEQAVRNAPEVDDYKVAYKRFLDANKLENLIK